MEINTAIARDRNNGKINAKNEGLTFKFNLEEPSPISRTNPTLDTDYVYSPLNTSVGSEEFRIIILYPRALDCDLRIEIMTSPLTDPPTFEAVSYCWNTSGPQQDISCQNGSFNQQIEVANRPKPMSYIKVHNNVKTILQDLQEPTPRLIWLDAICINQNDLEERARQVRIMDSIFAMARKVVVCLTLAENIEPMTADHGIKWLCQCRRYWSVIDKVSTAEGAHSPRSQPRPETLSYDQAKVLHYTVDNFLRNQWFERIWVVQEIVFAQSIKVQFGGMECDWDVLVDAAIESESIATLTSHGTTYLIRSIQELRRHWRVWSTLSPIIGNDTDIISREYLRTCAPLNLNNVLHATQRRRATDPRDMVYGVMSIAKHQDAESGKFVSYSIPVDYTLSVRDVYLSAFTTCIAKHFNKDDTSMDILSLSEFAPPGSDRWNKRNKLGRGEYWPSWLPDWSNPPFRYPIQHFVTREANFSFGGAEVVLEHDYDFPLSHGPCLRMRGLIALKIWKMVRYETQTDYLQHVSLLNELPEHYPMTSLNYGDVYLQILNPRKKNKQMTSMDHMPGREDIDDFSIAPSERISTFWEAKKQSNIAALSFNEKRDRDTEHRDEMRYTAENLEPLRHINRIMGLDLRRPNEGMTRNRMLYGRRVFASRTGFMGQVPEEAQEGDEIAVIPCLRVPYVVRRVRNHFFLIGPCYVLGLMDGEAMEGVDPSDFKDMYFL